MKLPRDQRQLAATAIAAGWRITKTGSQHYQWLSPDGKTIVVTGGTISDHRALKNIKARLRRGGLDL